jgi:hypothetical protein
MLQLNKNKDNITLSITTQLDKEDIVELIKDLQEYINTPTFHNKEHKEAYEQAQSKLKLEKELRRVFVDILDTEYLETKFATVYKLDEINREVETLKKKLKS